VKLTVNAEAVSYEEVISGFRRDLEEIFTFRRFYGSCIGKFSLAFRDKISLPFSGAKKSKIKVFFISCLLKIGPISCPETSVRIYHAALLNNPEELKSHLLRNLIWSKRPKNICYFL
jgi:hypothetical protein